MENIKYYCGFIAILGRPNVGKSTLLNQILKQKLCITSRKAQTTRHKILGVQTIENTQWIYVDTPGIHEGGSKALNKVLNKTAVQTLREVDCVLFVVDGTKFMPDDELVLSYIKRAKIPCILVINKVDKISDKSTLLPYIEKLSQQYAFESVVPISARTGLQVEVLQDAIKPFLPEGQHFYDEDEFTDKSTRFLCAELLREKVFRYCGDELPYSVSVEIESYQQKEDLVHIHALIWVEKESHKRMIIGDKGQKLKEMATQARLDMEKLVGQKVFLQCYCKVKSGWSNNERLLSQWGYGNN